MKINHIIVETTTAGAVATVSKPMGETQKRPSIAGLQPAEKVMSGKAKKKGPYQNSLSEGKMKELDYDLKNMKPTEFERKYGKKREEWLRILNKPTQPVPQTNKPVSEAELQEDDVIIVPGQGMKRRSGFVQHGQSRVDHEVDMARSDLVASIKNAKAIYDLLKDRSEEDGIEGWVQEKLIKASDYLNAVKEYLDEQQYQQESHMGGVIAGGGVGEGVESKGQSTNKDGLTRQEWVDSIKKKYPNAKIHITKMIDGPAFAVVDGKTIDWKRSDSPVKKKPMTPFGPGNKIDEKAVSKAQQRFMGMAHAMQKGKKIPGASKELKDVAKGMTKKAAHDFAATKHKGLPEKVKKKD